jgi:hypothetical protein
MRGGIRVRPKQGAGVGISVPRPGPVHQTGWSGRQGSGPARPILPNRDVLPEAWKAILETAAEDEFRKAVGR